MLTYAIGDVHGCFDKLVRLIDRCMAHAGARQRKFVFIGDYIDRGPDSRAVVELLIEMQSKMSGVICLRGNHEAMVVTAAEEGDRTEAWWLDNGGPETLLSYGVRRAAELPADHLRWFRSLPLSYDDGRRYFVHAGVDPERPLDRQDEHDQLWIREAFLYDERDYGRLIVHGHTPLAKGKVDLRPNRLNLDTAAVFDGPLSAAVFSDEKTEPVAFLTDVDAHGA
jgi:serine/threonine protein phosphatase 1